jgi:hypothetical protein
VGLGSTSDCCCATGAEVGGSVGFRKGVGLAVVGSWVKYIVGASVVSCDVGGGVGEVVGALVVGPGVGFLVGDLVGDLVGARVGLFVVGDRVGLGVVGEGLLSPGN